jgi:hypothetical protein
MTGRHKIFANVGVFHMRRSKQVQIKATHTNEKVEISIIFTKNIYHYLHEGIQKEGQLYKYL